MTKWNKNDKGDSGTRSIDFNPKVSRLRRRTSFFYRFPMSRKRLNKEALIADAFFSPTCRFDFVGLNIRQSFEREKAVRTGKRREEGKGNA